jgi:hypothetical protein
MDIQKNKNSLKIIIPKNHSIEDISTSGGSYNTPKTPNIPVNPVIQTEPNKDKKNGNNIKDKLVNNSSLNKNIQNNNNIRDENIDLYYPMAFTFNSKKGKKNKTLNNSRGFNYKYNKSFEKSKKTIIESKEPKEKIINKKRKALTCQKNNQEKNKKENNKFTKNKNLNNNKSFSYDKNKYKDENKNNIRNSQKEERKTRNNNVPLYDRKIRSAKKNKDTINIITMNNNIVRRNSKEVQKDLCNKKINLKALKSEYDKKKKEIVNLKVKSKINNILKKLPENYEKFPLLNNKFELFMKNMDDMEYALNRINSKKTLSKK